MGFIILFALFSATVLLAYFVIVKNYDDIVSVGVFCLCFILTILYTAEMFTA